jgi:hypothetical protein
MVTAVISAMSVERGMAVVSGGVAMVSVLESAVKGLLWQWVLGMLD